MKHLILTGFMGSGKTTVGKILAPSLKLPFIDLDAVIKKESGLFSHATILRFGEKAFRKIEKRCLRKILTGPACVLATGGGAMLNRQNREQMLAQGFVVWLKISSKLLLPRLKNGLSRPLLPKPLTQKNLKKIMGQRLPFYRQCHFSVANGFRPAKDVANLISRQYTKSQCIRTF